MDDVMQKQHERIDAISDLLSAADTLSQAVLLLQAIDRLGVPGGDEHELRKQATDELYRANDRYVDAYMRAFPKSGHTPPAAPAESEVDA